MKRPETPEAKVNFQLGDVVEILGTQGTVRFIGSTAFATGTWVGVELTEAMGKNDGSVQGKRYFECEPNFGVFVRASQVKSVLKSAAAGSRPASPADKRREKPRERSSSPSTQPTSRLSLPGSMTQADTSASSSNRRLTSIPKPGSSTTALPKTRQSSTLSSTPVEVPKPRMSLGGRPPLPAATRTASPPTIPEASTPPLVSPAVDSRPATPPDDTATQQSHVSTSVLATPAPLKLSHDQIATPQTIATPSTKLLQKNEIEELRLKLKAVEAQRAEDRERLKELQKLKVDLEATLAAKDKLTGKLSEMQTEVADVRKQLKEAVTAKQELDRLCLEYSDNLEMMSLDKEMAEEKAESMHLELEALKEKVEELTLDLEVYKHEREEQMKEDTALATYEGKPALEVTQLEKQNERLREALVKLRDVTSVQENELKLKVKTLEQENQNLTRSKEQLQELQVKFAATEEQIEYLKQQLEEAEEHQELLEQLTEKNLKLSETLEEQKLMIQDLEAMKELNEELEENHVEAEKEFQAAVDMRDSIIRELNLQLESAEETNADYEETLSRFRELVRTLQSDLQRIRSEAKGSAESAEIFSSQTQEMMNLNIQLQSTVLKSQSKAIDLELRKLEVIQATDRMGCIELFLPESFFEKDADCIQSYLLFKRVVFKADLIVRHLSESLNSPMCGNKFSPEEKLTMALIRQNTCMLSGIANIVVKRLETSAVDVYLSAQRLHYDMAGSEKKLDFFIDCLRREELRNTQFLYDLNRVYAQVKVIVEQLVDQTSTNVLFVSTPSICKALEYGSSIFSEWTNTLEHILRSVTATDSLLVATCSELVSLVKSALNDIMDTQSSIRMNVRKAQAQVDDLINTNEAASDTLSKDILDLGRAASTSSMFLFELIQGWTSRLKSPESSSVSAQSLVDVAAYVSETVFGSRERSMMVTFRENIRSLDTLLKAIVEALANVENLESPTQQEVPWRIRSIQLRSEHNIDLEAQSKLSALNDELVALARESKLKDELYQEANVKIELLEKRMAALRQQSDVVDHYEQEMGKLKEQGRLYTDAIHNLQMEMDHLEKENAHLRKSVKKLEKSNAASSRSAFSLMGSDASILASSIIKGDSAEALLSSQSEVLAQMQFLIRKLREENMSLKATQARELHRALLEPDAVVLFGRSIADKDSAMKSEVMEKQRTEAKSLLRDAFQVYASSTIVNLTLEVNTKHEWRSMKRRPEYQINLHSSLERTLLKRARTLQNQLVTLNRVGGECGAWQKEDQSATSSLPVGFVKFHTTTEGTKRRLLLNHEQFQQLHATFVQ